MEGQTGQIVCFFFGYNCI